MPTPYVSINKFLAFKSTIAAVSARKSLILASVIFVVSRKCDSLDTINLLVVSVGSILESLPRNKIFLLLPTNKPNVELFVVSSFSTTFKVFVLGI